MLFLPAPSVCRICADSYFAILCIAECVEVGFCIEDSPPQILMRFCIERNCLRNAISHNITSITSATGYYPPLPTIISIPAMSSSRPRSLIHCLREGELDVDQFRRLSRARACERENLRRARVKRRRRRLRSTPFQTCNSSSSHLFTVDSGNDGDEDSCATPVKTWRAQRGKKFMRMDANGTVSRIYPHTSTWQLMYVDNQLILTDDTLQKQFRNRFRMPYACYLELVEMCREDRNFRRWCAQKKTKQPSPIELLVLGLLRYLGRGWTFDDIEESTAISSEVHRQFLHSFLRFGSTVLFEQHVEFPKNFEEAKTHMAEFTLAGLPGCVGSADCTHITTEKCEYNLKNHHLGAKSSHTTRSFSLTANHRRRILHTSYGGPGRWNDQTMVMYDEFIKGIHNGIHLSDVSF